MSARSVLSFVALAALALPAFAHPGHLGDTGSLLAGLSHPLSGPDHLLAMISIGLWAACLGGRAVWMVPAAFLLGTAAGFGLALAGIGLPLVEPGIAASVIALGALIAFAVHLPLAASMLLAGLFAVFHGQAHGAELVGAAWSFGTGFIVTTALLHLAGIAVVRVGTGPRRGLLMRSLGGVVTISGMALLAGVWA
ncbi:MAG: HupE/UreJ family protein [Burkholderiaceae bacterium]